MARKAWWSPMFIPRARKRNTKRSSKAGLLACLFLLPAAAQQAPFTLEQVLGAAFPTELTAAPIGGGGVRRLGGGPPPLCPWPALLAVTAQESASTQTDGPITKASHTSLQR